MSEQNHDLQPGQEAAAVAPEAVPETMPEPVSAPAPEPVVRQVGQVLREAREGRGLSVFEVAQSLKFSVRQIEALEADDYGALPPGATFLRGFVRGYAKLLKLDPAGLLEMLDGRAPAALPDVRAPQNMGVAATPVAAGRRSSSPMLLGAAVLALVAAGLAAWHFLGGPLQAPPPAQAVGPSAAAAPRPDAEAVRPPDIRIEQTPAAGAGAQPAGVPLPPDQKQLVFTFQEKSWVEVRDATQRIVYSGENQAGTRQAVAGKPPFQLVVGNAAKVELQYEDRQVDLKPHIRAEVARLTVE